MIAADRDVSVLHMKMMNKKNRFGHIRKNSYLEQGESYEIDEEGSYVRSEPHADDNASDSEVYRPDYLKNGKINRYADEADDAMRKLHELIETVKQTEAAERMKQTMISMDARMLRNGSSDTACTENKVKCVFDLPDGFFESEDTPHMYVTERYPEDPSNIFYLTEPAEAGMQSLDEEGFRATVEDAYEDKFGDLIDVNVEEFTEFFMDRYRSFRIRCSYDVEKIHMMQLEYVINADRTFIIIYTTVGDSARMAQYEESAKTISLQ